jgi:hypothetical protein
MGFRASFGFLLKDSARSKQFICDTLSPGRTQAPDGAGKACSAWSVGHKNTNNKQQLQHMKKLNHLYHSMALPHARGFLLAVLAIMAVIALSGSALRTRVQLVADPQIVDAIDQTLLEQVHVRQMLSAYHGALAHGGDIDAMASLWADDSSLTLNNGTPYIGKDAVLGFFASGPYFSHDWVSLSSEWKTTVTVHGNIAEATTQCIATDVSVTPNVIRGVIQVNVTFQRKGGTWLMIQMNNFTEPQI